MAGCAPGLQVVGAEVVPVPGAFSLRQQRSDQAAVPKAAVLLIRQQQVAAGIGASTQAGGVGQQQRQRSVHARYVAAGLLYRHGRQPDHLGAVARVMAVVGSSMPRSSHSQTPEGGT